MTSDESELWWVGEALLGNVHPASRTDGPAATRTRPRRIRAAAGAGSTEYGLLLGELPAERAR